jgi:hypothetical protein
LFQATLRTQPFAGLEVYRPGTLLAGDSRHLARLEGWAESPLDDLVIAGPGEAPQRMAGELLEALAPERSRLVRLAVRRQAPHLTVALNVPDPARFDADDARRLAQRLAERLAP